MTLLIVYLLLALVVSFLCSLLEATLLSTSDSFVSAMERRGGERGRQLRRLKENIDRPLAAILSLNTIAHTVGAAGVGAQAQIIFGSAYIGITSAVVTFLILVFSEIIPKTLGATYWRALAPISTPILNLMVVSMYPLVLLSKGITKVITRGSDQPSFSREEFSALAERGHEEGIFEEGESNIVKNLIRFSSLRIKDIMTPRIVVVYFNQDITVREMAEQIEDIRVSRIPVYAEKEDNITGYVLKTDILIHIARGDVDKSLKELKRDLLLVPEMANLKVLFERLLKSQDHIAAAVDEYGGFSGVVTMEDVVETLLGMEIIDEADAYRDLQKLARKKWRERARRLGIVTEEEDSEPAT